MKVNKMTLSDVIPVDFSWLGKVKSGVKTLLESRVLKWDNRVSGKKAKILEDVGVILVPARYTLNFYSPKPGEKVEGLVKNWTDKEIGALSEGFNTILSVENCRFESDFWRDVNGTEVRRDCKVAFILEK